ncbi:MAG TPA: AAA family ATPase [Candidatus Woesebacteria bacterium]|nr:AAA family ATPase [Candidatus Woesebacteria bacterium]HNS95238.1 AAA family ATPase [Candidatus Woesebacteria bacterium]
MSVLDFIKKPTPTSNAASPGVAPAPIVPQYAATPAGLQTPPAPNISSSAAAEIDPAEQARQAYVADLLKKYPQPAAPVAKTQPVASAVQGAPPTPAATSAQQAPPAPSVASTVPPASSKKPSPTASVGKSASAEGGQMSRQELLDLMTHLAQRSNKVFLAAQTKAKEVQSEWVDSEHVLSGLMTDAEIVKLLGEMKVDTQKVDAALAQLFKRAPAKKPPQIAPRIKTILQKALEDARKSGVELVAPEHLLLSLFEEGEGIGARLLAKLGVQGEDLRKRVMSQVASQNKGQVNPDGTITKPGEAKKSALSSYTIDITAKAERGELDAVVERAEEIERVVQVLSRRTKNNPALVGEPGVGKTAILEGLAQRIAARQVPEILLGKHILQLDLMSVLAGASHRGEFEQRMKDLIEEICAANGQYIMFIDEMHTIVGAGGGGDNSLDAANFLKPALARGDLQMIGATTLTEYRKYVEKDPALERRFQTVQVPEPTEEAAIKMLKALRPKYEKFHNVTIPDDAVESAVKLSKRYVGDRFLPDKAIDLMDEAASAVRLPLMSLPEKIKSLEERIGQLHADMQKAESKGDTVRAKVLKAKLADLEPKMKDMQQEYESKKNQSNVQVTESIIKDVVSRWTGVPVSKLSGSESDRLTKLEQIMHERMIGQERPVKAVAAAVRRGRAGLKSNKRPIGSFIFLGPSGVGKTELTKTLAEVLFGQEDAMIRFDMTEFMEKHEVAKLLGPPPGYVGYEEGGKLTEAVRRKPYSVVLFDEVEKAHPDIFNILLQILDDGRLTDNKGRTISFKNTVVICTSNIGTQLIQDKLLQKQSKKDQDEKGQSEHISADGKTIVAGKQSEKRVPAFTEPSHEFTDMKADDIAPAYRGAKANFNEPELQVGYEFEDEVQGDLSQAKYNELRDLVMGELRKFFRPELINRFDEVIVFEPLALKHMKKIVELQLKALVKLLEEQNIGLTVTDVAKEQIVTAGFDPVYGARPLRRAIQKLLENPISEMIIGKKVQDGDIIVVDFTDDFVFTTEKPKQVMADKEAQKARDAQTDEKNKKAQSEVTKNAGDQNQKEKTPHFAMYVCVDSGMQFETEEVPNSTVICPFNAKEKTVKASELPQLDTAGPAVEVIQATDERSVASDVSAGPFQQATA